MNNNKIISAQSAWRDSIHILNNQLLTTNSLIEAFDGYRRAIANDKINNVLVDIRKKKSNKKKISFYINYQWS